MKTVLRHVFIFFFFMSISCAVSAETIIDGQIKAGRQFAASSDMTWVKKEKFVFPRKHYNMLGVYISQLHYNENSKSHDIDLKPDAEILADGSLDLVSYDETTKQIKFRLTMQPNSLDQAGTHKPIDGKITFDKKADACIITGTINYVGGMPKFQLIKELSNCNMNITFDISQVGEFLEFTTLENIPVTITIA